MDDVAHLAAGISNWELGRFDLYKVNPPLVRMMAAMPVMFAGAETDYGSYSQGVGARPEFAVMDDFTQANGQRLIWLVTLARWGLIPLAMLGGCICYRWASELYGDAAGLLAISLWSFSPNLLAYAQILTADAGAATLGVSASYFFWKWLRDPDWERAVLAGMALGLAELTKTTWAVLLLLWPAMWIAWEFSSHDRGARRRTVQLAATMAVGLLCLNAGYNFEGSATRLRNYIFLSGPLTGKTGNDGGARFGNRFRDSWLGYLPMPLPKNYVEGIDLQWHDVERGKPSYLRGRWQDRGWWYWYLYALAVKVPLGTLGLLLLALGLRVARCRQTSKGARPGSAQGNAQNSTKGADLGPRHKGEGLARRDEFVLLAPAAAVFMLVSSQTGFSRYIRYVLPILPFVFIWISSVACGITRKQRKTAVAAVVLLSWSIGSSLWHAPHWMSYFNELAGGPLGGPSHLIDAQVDWGQDLLYLKKWLDAHQDARPLGLVYFGPIHPELAGITFAAPPKGTLITDDRAEVARVPHDLSPGWYAVSVNHLYGYPHYVYDENGCRQWVTRPYYSYFRRFRTVASAGYSIYIYHLASADISAARLPASP